MRELVRRTGLLALLLSVLFTLTGCHLVLPFAEPPAVDTNATFLCTAQIYRDTPAGRLTEEWQAYVAPGTGMSGTFSYCQDRVEEYIDEYKAPGFRWHYLDLNFVDPGKIPTGTCTIPQADLEDHGGPVGAELRWTDPPTERAYAYVYLVDKEGGVRTAEPAVKSVTLDVAERTGYPTPTGLYEPDASHLWFTDIYVELDTPFNLGDFQVDQLQIQSIGTALADYTGPDFSFSRDLQLFMHGTGEGGLTDLCITRGGILTGRLHQGPPYSFFSAGLNIPIPELGPEGRVKLSLSIPTSPGAFDAHQPYVSMQSPKFVGTDAILSPDIAFDHDNDLTTFFWFKDYEQPTEVFLGTGNPATTTLEPGAHEVTVVAYDSRGTYDTATANVIALAPIIINSAPLAVNDAYTDAGVNLDYVEPAPGILANDSDANGDPLTAQLLDQPAHGTVTLNGDGGFTYSPGTDFTGTDTFTYVASDGSLTSNAATVAIQVNPEPDAFRISEMGPDGDPDYRANTPDVAYNPNRNEFLVVWTADDDADTLDNEFEIWGQRLDAATGAKVGPQVRISNMRPNPHIEYDAFDPAVVFNPVREEYLVVWSGDDETDPLEDNEFEIFGQRLDAWGNHTGFNDFRISDMGVDGDWTYAALSPAVAHNADRDEYLVVWGGDDNSGALVNGEFEIFGQRLTGAGLEIGLNDFRISSMGPDGSTSYGGGAPDVVFNPVRNEYLVVWTGDDNRDTLVDGEGEVFGQRLDTEGVPIGLDDFRISDMGPDGSTDYGAWNSAVIHYEPLDYYFVVWRGDDNTGGLADGEFEIFGQLLNGDGTEVADDVSRGNDFRISSNGPDGDTDYQARTPALAYNAGSNEYLVTWRGVASPPTATDAETEIFGQRLLVNGVGVGAQNRRISSMGPDGDVTYDANDPAVAANPSGNEWLVVWSGDLGFPPLVQDEFEILGYKYPGGPPVGSFFVDAGPDAEDDSVSTAEGGTVTEDLLDNDSDPEGADLTAPEVVTPPEHGVVVVHSAHAVSYTHDGSETLSDSFTYRTSDGAHPSNVATVTVTIVPVNDPPVAVNDTAVVPNGGSVVIDVHDNDMDTEGNALFPIVADPPVYGSVLEVGDTIVYTHDGSAQSADSFTYWASDGGALSGLATVNVTVGAPAGPATLALFEPDTGRWHLRHADGQVDTFFYGVPGDLPLLGDWDCDGIDTVAMYRPSNGFVYIRNSNTFGVADQDFFYGMKGDIPLAGDWDGDGCDTLAIYRQSKVYVSNQLGTHPAEFSYWFGIPGDKPFAGDFDGDGITTVGLYRDTTGFVYFRDALSTGIADFEFYYGVPSDRIVAGDWDGDGDETVGIFRPSEGRFYLSNANVQGFADITFDFGESGWLPTEGSFGPLLE